MTTTRKTWSERLSDEFVTEFLNGEESRWREDGDGGVLSTEALDSMLLALE